MGGIFRPCGRHSRRSGRGWCLRGCSRPLVSGANRPDYLGSIRSPSRSMYTLTEFYWHRCALCDINYQVQKVQYRDSGARRATWQVAPAYESTAVVGVLALQLIRQRLAACTHERKCGAEARGNLQLPGRDSGDGGKSASERDARGSNGMGFSRPQGGTFLSISRQHARRWWRRAV